MGLDYHRPDEGDGIEQVIFAGDISGIARSQVASLGAVELSSAVFDPSAMDYLRACYGLSPYGKDTKELVWALQHDKAFRFADKEGNLVITVNGEQDDLDLRGVPVHIFQDDDADLLRSNGSPVDSYTELLGYDQDPEDLEDADEPAEGLDEEVDAE